MGGGASNNGNQGERQGTNSSVKNNMIKVFRTKTNQVKQQDPGIEELRILLVGSAGAGKSATGNCILGEEKFESRASPNSVTLECEKEVCDWKGRRLVVVDTPGFLNKKRYKRQVKKECLKLCAPGPHAIVMVLQAGRFSQEEQKSLKTIRKVFGREALTRMVIVFSRKDDLGETTIQDFVSASETHLQKLISKCGGRYCAFNNRATGEDRDRQVKELIEIIDRI